MASEKKKPALKRSHTLHLIEQSRIIHHDNLLEKCSLFQIHAFNFNMYNIFWGLSLNQHRLIKNLAIVNELNKSEAKISWKWALI